MDRGVMILTGFPKAKTLNRLSTSSKVVVSSKATVIWKKNAVLLNYNINLGLSISLKTETRKTS